MDLKDKLNLVWKFLFLAVFTYGVVSFTCYKDCDKSRCDKSGSYAYCESKSKGCSAEKAQCDKAKKQCKSDCSKPCCKDKVSG